MVSGGKRKGAGRPKAEEPKQRITLRAYPSKVELVKAKGSTAQKLLDWSMEINPSNEERIAINEFIDKLRGE